MIDPDKITAENLLPVVRDLQRQVNALIVQNQHNATVFAEYGDTIEDRFQIVEDNREKSDNVTEALLRHLGVDMAPYGDPPQMTIEQIEDELDRIRNEEKTR